MILVLVTVDMTNFFIGHMLSIRIAVTEPFLTVVFGHNSDAIQFTHLMCNSIAFGIFTELCILHHKQL